MNWYNNCVRQECIFFLFRDVFRENSFLKKFSAKYTSLKLTGKKGEENVRDMHVNVVTLTNYGYKREASHPVQSQTTGNSLNLRLLSQLKVLHFIILHVTTLA